MKVRGHHVFPYRFSADKEGASKLKPDPVWMAHAVENKAHDVYFEVLRGVHHGVRDYTPVISNMLHAH